MNFLKKINDNQYLLNDHAGGFTDTLTNSLLDSIPLTSAEVITEYVADDFCQRYPNLKFNINLDIKKRIFETLTHYNIHQELTFQNFVCSFNGSPHVSRKILVAALHRRNWFNRQTCSKNFVFDTDTIDGHLLDYLDGDQHTIYRYFFIDNNSTQFFQETNSFGHLQYDHANNIYNLESKLTESFLHIVSETMATSYYPFVTEKFLYSVVTRGLFLAYAQPGWHTHLEKYFGFKRYTKLFDYHFDTIQNPIKRLVELMSMISKFSVLSKDDWQDLYEIEKDAIEYNYDHYFSGDYLKKLQAYA